MDIFTIVLIILVALVANILGSEFGLKLKKFPEYLKAMLMFFLSVVLLIISYYIGKRIQIGVNKVRGIKEDNSFSSKVFYTLITFVIICIMIELGKHYNYR
tara:strand:+ start:444 stop:746 length:303 start_codon:yes stop_codon:yes gene_type:complete